MFYTDDVIEDVRTGNNIVDVAGSYVSLKKSGSSTYVGLCPFHREHTPSFSINEDKQLFYCFGCGVGGNVINFISRIENFDFKESIEYLAKRIGYSLPEENMGATESKRQKLKNRLYEMHTDAARFFYNQLKDGENSKAANDYLDMRQMTHNIRIRYGIGVSPHFGSKLCVFLKEKGYNEEEIISGGLASKSKKNNKIYDRFSDRLMFPIIDVSKRIIGFGGRILDNSKDSAKYLNSPETPIFSKSNNLYSLNFAKQSGTRTFILVEGYMDVISLAQAGFNNAVAALGTAFNENHARVIKRYADNVILLFDSDSAGERAVLRAITQLESVGINPKVLQVKNAKDPDEFIKKFGAPAFAELLKGAKDNVYFQIELKKRDYDFGDARQKAEFSKETAKIISKIQSPVEREIYTKEAAKEVGVSAEALTAEIDGIAKSDRVYNFNSSARYRHNKADVKSNAYIEAQKAIINIIATSENKAAKGIIKNALSCEKFENDVCRKLFNLICGYDEKGISPSPAELINVFQDDEAAQRLASEIFMKSVDYAEAEEFEQAVNDYIYTINKNYILAQMSRTDDIERLQELLKEQKELNKNKTYFHFL